MRLRLLASGPVIVALLLGLTLSLVWASGSPVDDPYSPLNTQWNGTSELATRGFVPVSAGLGRILSSTDAPAILLEIGPSRQFTTADADSIRDLLAKGGLLVVADSYGSGNQLLELLGLPVKFDGRLLTDPLFYRKQPVFPVCFDLAPSAYSAGLDKLVLNYATVLNITDQAEVSVLASSSAFSFLDSDRDGVKDPEEPSGPFPILAEVGMSKGKVVLFTSPASFANGMIHEAGNGVLIENIIQTMSQPTRVSMLLLDEMHLEPSPFTAAKLSARSLVISIIEGGMGFAGKLALIVLTMSIIAARFLVRKPSLETETSKPYRTIRSFDVDSAMQLHPTWNRRQLEYVARELEVSMKWRHLRERE